MNDSQDGQVKTAFWPDHFSFVGHELEFWIELEEITPEQDYQDTIGSFLAMTR